MVIPTSWIIYGVFLQVQSKDIYAKAQLSQIWIRQKVWMEQIFMMGWEVLLYFIEEDYHLDL